MKWESQWEPKHRGVSVVESWRQPGQKPYLRDLAEGPPSWRSTGGRVDAVCVLGRHVLPGEQAGSVIAALMNQPPH